MAGPTAATATGAAKSLCFLAAGGALALPCPPDAQRTARETLSVAAAPSRRLPVEEAARALLTGPKGRAILERCGYALP